MYSLVHVLDTAAISLEYCQHTQSLLPFSTCCLSVGRRSIRFIWLGVTLIDVLMLSEPS